MGLDNSYLSRIVRLASQFAANSLLIKTDPANIGAFVKN